MPTHIKGPAAGATGSGGAASASGRVIPARPAADARRAATPDGGDQVSLSGDATRIRTLAAGLGSLPEVDTARVERLRAAISEGHYHVHPERIAARFLEFEEQLPGGQLPGERPE
jgi:negative regulator of flagellin synthesis FlgM